MRRILYRDLYSSPKTLQLTGREVLTPNLRAARVLGVTPKTISDLARQILNDKGLEVASQLTARRTLQSTVHELLGTEDSYSTARTLAPTLQTIFRAGLDLSALEQTDSSRARRIARLALSYRARLRQKGLIDPDEALWEA